MFYSISRKPTLRISKIEGIAYITCKLLQVMFTITFNCYDTNDTIAYINFLHSIGFKHQTTSSQRAGNPAAIGLWNSWRCRTRIFGQFGQIVRRPRTFVRNSRKMSRSFGMFGKSSNDSTKPRTPTKWLLNVSKMASAFLCFITHISNSSMTLLF